ncbi:MAG: NUDIX domain-containing protein [Pegethrix bostrychoides GSE-TBD4-15B]|jgi:ADP-ribose pyrophosphatase YjhB (NUDIX family)|uniref:NUDIX domain-containing protein n=1 Tax=Pegethrix bostrychoides GSE-TBD4-15B TaxID=2839662 RepID=A0A951P8F9_9CYAN|nr:NUDIX domain-containing protein [Pegethrix bostrychoides GSE-TBD4-15B]
MDDFRQISSRLTRAFHVGEALVSQTGSKIKATRTRTRLRGTALVETEQGILIVSEDGLRFSLPGGAAEKDELWIETAIRELREETGLKAYSAIYLFSHMGGIRKRSSGYSRNYHKVFLIQAEGVPKPRQEIQAIQFYQPGDPVKLSNSTRIILNRYRML